MADIITAFGLSFLLYNEIGAATEGLDPVSPKSTVLNTALFTALGFIVGNVGSNLASEVTLARMLWPERYYHTKSPWKLAVMGLTMSAAGPFQAAGKRAMDGFLRNGLFKGAKEGDMLGTAFFEDSQTGYRASMEREGRVEPAIAEDARNNFWAAVVASIRQESLAASGTDEERVRTRTGEFANRRIYLLTLIHDEPRSSNDEPNTVNKKHIDSTLPVMLLGAFFSEMSGVIAGTAAAAVWHSPFAIVWFVPLLLRLIAIRFRVRRVPLVAMETPKGEENNESLTKPCAFEIDDHKHGFVLIQAPEALGTQFFHHFGHPQRSKLSSDRWNERVSMGLVIVVGAYFPISWVAFAFAPQALRWTWVCYQLYVLVTLLVLTYWDLLRVGSLEEDIADALSAGKTVHLGNDDTGYVKVDLDWVQASRIAEAREIVESKKLEILGIEKKNA